MMRCLRVCLGKILLDSSCTLRRTISFGAIGIASVCTFKMWLCATLKNITCLSTHSRLDMRAGCVCRLRAAFIIAFLLLLLRCCRTEFMEKVHINMLKNYINIRGHLLAAYHRRRGFAVKNQFKFITMPVCVCAF